MPDKYELYIDEKTGRMEVYPTRLEHIPLTKQEEADYAYYEALGKHVSEQQQEDEA